MLVWDDIRAALAQGWRDFLRTPGLSMFFGAVAALFGLVFTAGLLVYDQIWMIVPAGVGFPLVAPFLAAGLYEMSRRYQSGETFTWGDILGIVVRQQRREFGWMAFVMLFVFWIWIYQARLLLAIFLQWTSFSSLEGLVHVITTTSNGAMFLGLGTIVGALLATVLFSITVISMPLLLDEEIDFISAMILSVKSVLANRAVMLGFGVVIALATFIAIVPLFAGLVVVFPVLGHATWHVYRRALEKKT
jgi:uncharacterized membrane protein